MAAAVVITLTAARVIVMRRVETRGLIGVAAYGGIRKAHDPDLVVSLSDSMANSALQVRSPSPVTLRHSLDNRFLRALLAARPTPARSYRRRRHARSP